MTISTPNNRGGDEINMSLQITSSSNSSIKSEATTNNQDRKPHEIRMTTKNHDKNHHEEIMTLKQRKTNILQAMNSSNANDNNDNPPRNNLRSIGQPTIQSRATSNITRKYYKKHQDYYRNPRNTMKTPNKTKQQTRTRAKEQKPLKNGKQSLSSQEKHYQKLKSNTR
jgi:hypothetical protein